MWIANLMSNVGGWAGDWLILKRRNSTATARKTVNTLGFLSSAAALMLMPGAGQYGVSYGVLVTTLTLGCLGFSRGGFSVNHMDIAPKYAGMVMGISNTAGTVSGVIGVSVTGYILDMGVAAA
jgi:ACS family sodium-dependent inorganic phosphate cotransporter